MCFTCFLGQEKCSYKCLSVATLKTEIHYQQVEWFLHISNTWSREYLTLAYAGQRKSEWGLISCSACALPSFHLIIWWKKTMLLCWTVRVFISLQHYCLYKKSDQIMRGTPSPDAVIWRSWNFMKSHPVLRLGFGLDFFFPFRNLY